MKNICLYLIITFITCMSLIGQNKTYHFDTAYTFKSSEAEHPSVYYQNSQYHEYQMSIVKYNSHSTFSFYFQDINAMTVTGTIPQATIEDGVFKIADSITFDYKPEFKKLDNHTMLRLKDTVVNGQNLAQIKFALKNKPKKGFLVLLVDTSKQTVPLFYNPLVAQIWLKHRELLPQGMVVQRLWFDKKRSISSFDKLVSVKNVDINIIIEDTSVQVNSIDRKD